MDILKELDLVDINESELKKDSVIIRFGRFESIDVIHALDERLFNEIPEHIGKHDGHEVSMDDSHGTLFTYGSNAETLFKTMHPILDGFDFLEGAVVHLTFNRKGNEPLDLEFEFKKNCKP